jgi:UDP-N-acetylmuramate dehydrogenase
VGGPAEYFCLPKNIEELQQAQDWARQKNMPIQILAGGSNVLVADEGVPGLTICLKNFSGTQVEIIDGQLRIVAMAGTSKSELLKIYLKYKLAPALFLAGIPGDVGGGVVMNAGVAENFKPREFVELVEWIEVLKPNNQVRRYQNSEIQWSYRHSSGWQSGIIVNISLLWPNLPDDQILDQVRQANKIRLSKQPLDMPSCGSVFVNPPGHKAAQLIDSCGLKGFTVGGAQVSQKHANFIVNIGNAKAKEIWQTICHVQEVVRKNKAVDLKTEVVLLGNWRS